MKRLRQLLPPAILLILIIVGWLWWNRPQRVDMTAYVPADAVVYIEANSLPDIASGIIETDDWKALAPPAGIKLSAGRIGWLSRLAAWTGIGPADMVVLSRAQVAVTVLGFDAADAGDTLKIKPRIALVAHTHTGESRTQTAVQKLIGDFARRAYGELQVKNEEIDGIKFTVWNALGSNRRIVAAVMDELAVIGNDEASVRACLAVRRGERPSLAGNPQLDEMRRRLGANDAASFGYVSPAGSAQLVELAATVYAAQISNDARAQSAAASLLLPLANKILGGVGWSARIANGAVEDRYFLALQNGVAERLREPFSPASTATLNASELLPAETYALSRYNYRDPAVAWKGLYTTLSAQGGVIEYGIISRLLNSALKPYGIEEPESFLHAIGSEIVTARLDDAGASTVTLVEVRDEKALRDFVNKRLGPNPRTERIGDADMLVSREAESGAASFIAGHLLLGSAANVRRCLEARKENRTLSSADAFLRTARAAAATNPAGAVTYMKDEKFARNFMNAIAAQRGTSEHPVNNEMEQALQSLPYSVSETRLLDGGFEKKTRSSFGLFGTLVTQFAPEQ